MYGPIVEVDMKCVWERGEWRVVVTSTGAYHRYFVNCSKAVRGPNVQLRGFVMGNTKWDADDTPFCVLVTEGGKRDWDAFTLVYDPHAR
ncbi:hypothetical protein [Deinococcus yavapaiensis]|uniref:Uncharacterized protein n=1 Tax=Deinococcus yavapaiensis KR-236 TaxID=694435 RepID=A0A318SF48_9DEIO|nr:hypothetical protein [Deinococcus yavapaiensis]PYE52009.1 hypothetical protein DES52_11355 [Deinococcus yavapaiensis KR-236]